MCSQRRYITDVEIYGKNAERFLSLRHSGVETNESTDRYDRAEHRQSKALRVKFDQNDDERYQCTLAAYLEVLRIVDKDCHL